MEIISRQQQQQQHDHPSPANSPSSNGSTTTQTPPLTPRPISRSEPNPYPTTFVQADTNSFKQVVQMLTGSSKPVQENPSPAKISIPPVKTGQQKKSKLYERRNSLSLKNGLMINNINNPSATNGFGSTRVQELLSPSILDFPALALSPVTPLTDDMFNKSSPLTVGNSSEEERVIAEKGFYLHPSPRGTTAEPQLLPLFPVTSPRVIN